MARAGVHCRMGGGGDFRRLSDRSLMWIWEGAQRAGLALDRGAPRQEAAPTLRIGDSGQAVSDLEGLLGMARGRLRRGDEGSADSLSRARATRSM